MAQQTINFKNMLIELNTSLRRNTLNQVIYNHTKQ